MYFKKPFLVVFLFSLLLLQYEQGVYDHLVLNVVKTNERSHDEQSRSKKSKWYLGYHLRLLQHLLLLRERGCYDLHDR